MSQTIELCPNRFVGGNNPVFVIAEAGINHQGDINIAKELIKAAKEAGADCVKFQKRTIERILTKEGLEKPYINNNSFGATYGEHKRTLELSYDDFCTLMNYADDQGIFMTASGWDEESVDFLYDIGVPFFKVASADLTNFLLLEHTARKGKPMVLSTGMANMETVYKAFHLVYNINKNIVILQCTSTYPAEFSDLNLNVIKTYQTSFSNAVIGYSGHEKGIAISLATCVMGAKVIERHLTLDRTMKGGDHSASLEPDGLKKLIRDIRAYEEALGDGIKVKLPSEEKIFIKLSKSVVSKIKIKAGDELTKEMLTTKGPGIGISPMDLQKIIGMKAKHAIEEDVVITWDDVV